jgi:RNA polymerase sigma-70 factor (ECF subfamily)
VLPFATVGRKAVDERLPERSQQATLRALGDEEVRELVEAYIDAWSRRDVEAIAALLAEDAVFSMPPWPKWWQGRERIASFATNEDCFETRTVPIRANGQAALASYSLDEETGQYVPAAIDVLTLEGDHRVRHARDLLTLRSPSGARALTGSS